MTDSPERAIDPVEELRTSIRQFVQYVEAIPHDLWLTKIVNWTPRDVVAHLIGWNVCMLEGCELMRAGKAPTYLNDGNTIIGTSTRHRSIDTPRETVPRYSANWRRHFEGWNNT